MNIWQVTRQLEYLIRSRYWEGDNTNEKVIRPVPTAGLTREALKDVKLPFVLITPLGGPADGEDPDLWDETIRFVIVAGVEGDDHGKMSLLGGVRSAGQGSSKGRGLLELQEEVMAAVRLLSTGTGLVVQGRNLQAGEAAQDEEYGYITSRQLLYSVKCTAFRYYHPCDLFAAEDATGGNCDLTWALPPDRFDRRKMMLRRAAGSTAPATIADGTEVVLASDLAVSHTDNPGAGTFSYSLFAGYLEKSDDMPPMTGTPDRWSDPVSVTVVVT